MGWLARGSVASRPVEIHNHYSGVEHAYSYADEGAPKEFKYPDPVTDDDLERFQNERSTQGWMNQ